MRKLILMTLAFGMALILGACRPGLIEQFAGSPFADDLSDEAVTNVNEASGASYVAEGIDDFPAFNFTGVVNESGQLATLEVDTTGSGPIYIDPDSVSGAVAFYPITDPGTDEANVEDLPARGSALSYETEVVYTGTRTVLRFTVDLSGLTTDTVEIAIDPTTLTANGGTTKLNLDGDDVQGETEDAVVGTFTIGQSAATGATTITDFGLAFSAIREPRATVASPDPGEGVEGTLAIGGEIPWDPANDTSGGGGDVAANLTAANLSSSISVEAMGATASDWSAASMATATLDGATGAFTYDFQTATAAADDGQVYRVVTDLYAIQEQTATRGYQHRAFYQQNDMASRYNYAYYFVDGGGEEYGAGGWNDLNGTDPAASTIGGEYFVLVDFTSTADGVDTDTISNTSVFIRDEDTGEVFDWTRFEVVNPNEQNEGQGPVSEVRLFMPATFDPAGRTFELVATPELKDGDDDPATENQNEADPYGSTVNDDGSIETVSNTFVMKPFVSVGPDEETPNDWSGDAQSVNLGESYDFAFEYSLFEDPVVDDDVDWVMVDLGNYANYEVTVNAPEDVDIAVEDGDGGEIASGTNEVSFYESGTVYVRFTPSDGDRRFAYSFEVK